MRTVFSTITIVGVGLIGGSIGLAAKKRGVAGRIVGVGRDPQKLHDARRLGAIDEAATDLAEAVREADLVVFCTPVDRIVEQVTAAAQHAKKDAAFTDAGSTKAMIVRQVDAAALGGVRFVGSHPLAGSEKKGAEHADADLFVERTVVLTPTEQTSALGVVGGFWQSLGARLRVMSPEEHDEALAFTSHLPHLLASALAGMLPDDWHDLAASGFRDTTRVAAGDPEVWSPIFRHNRRAVLESLDQLIVRLVRFRQALVADEVSEIDQFLAQGKKVRDALGS
ncbi:MAG: prephenate dehydrogenase/arogenate dehydrogenase family protein [Planctomycetes bacterium]|nr:prephenate dehydrogenase/arogenate dehydrogenase family protein [Planctomycetota bacterium]